MKHILKTYNQTFYSQMGINKRGQNKPKKTTWSTLIIGEFLLFFSFFFLRFSFLSIFYANSKMELQIENTKIKLKIRKEA